MTPNGRVPRVCKQRECVREHDCKARGAGLVSVDMFIEVAFFGVDLFLEEDCWRLGGRFCCAPHAKARRGESTDRLHAGEAFLIP